MTKKDKIVIVIIAVLLTIFIVCFVLFFIKEDEKNYNETLNSPPTYNYIEQDLESILISRNIQVLYSNQNNDEIIYRVKVDETEYAVLYKIKSMSKNVYITYKWNYISHRLVKCH